MESRLMVGKIVGTKRMREPDIYNLCILRTYIWCISVTKECSSHRWP